MLERTLRHTNNLNGAHGYNEETVSIATIFNDANLICSDMPPEKWNTNKERLHVPTLDIDHPVTVIPSSTPGHYHLFIDYPLTWENYVKLMDVMAEVGILEPGYVDASHCRGFSTLRLPWIHKDS